MNWLKQLARMRQAWMQRAQLRQERMWLAWMRQGRAQLMRR
jgi:hypothetical protein